ncbi:hypothetical protein FRC12_008767 [Ceratobasidium sp. 428]|nr:hypothetical protein FRC12_008767 [Ceratobasidium sp. 428]
MRIPPNASHPTVSQVDLAVSLNSLSSQLWEQGRRDDALKAVQKAVELTRQLAEDRAIAFVPQLAALLNNLANYSSDAGQPQKALDAIEEAVSLSRSFAQ